MTGFLGAVSLSVPACSDAVAIGSLAAPPDATTLVAEGGTKPVDASMADAPDAGEVISVEAGDDVLSACGCVSTEICVAHRMVGGAQVYPDDAGVCDPGRHPETVGATLVCENDWIFSCELRPKGCPTTIACSCAGLFCQNHTFGTACSDEMKTKADLQCEELLP